MVTVGDSMKISPTAVCDSDIILRVNHVSFTSHACINRVLLYPLVKILKVDYFYKMLRTSVDVNLGTF